MFIENNILKYYLKDVYFITGTAYAGKSTMVKMLSERYNMVLCHRDFWVTNIFYQDEQIRVIDWDTT